MAHDRQPKRKSLPPLPRSHVRHFDFANDPDQFIESHRQAITLLAKRGVRRPLHVAEAFNKEGRKTACGERWDNFTVGYLLHFLFNGISWKDLPKAEMDMREPYQITGRKPHAVKNPNSGKITVEEAYNRHVKNKNKNKSNIKNPCLPSINNNNITKKNILKIKEVDLEAFRREIPKLKPWQLMQIWRRCIPEALKNPQSIEARAVADIERVWATGEFSDDEYFTWPIGWAKPGLGKIDRIDDWPELGLLKQMGYQVGKEAKSESFRRALLSKILDAHLPPLLHPDYIAEWGAPGTAARLRKMAHSVAAFARNADRQGPRLALAVEHWQGDLQFLHDKFYVDRFGFDWPSSRS